MMIALARKTLSKDLLKRHGPFKVPAGNSDPFEPDHARNNTSAEPLFRAEVTADLLDEVLAERSSKATPLLKGATDLELAKYPAIQRALRTEARLRLQPGNRSGFVECQDIDPKGVILALHGWSAGTWQFEHLAGQFAKRGYHVYAPRLPGHGCTNHDGVPTTQEFPTNNQVHLYTEFADRVYKEAASLNLPIHVIGLSGGGTIALDIAGRHNVSTAVLYDPFLSPGKPHADNLMTIFKWLDRFTMGQSSLLLKLLPVVFATPKLNVERWGRNGHVEFNAAHLYTLTHYGREAIERAKNLRISIQLVTSDYEPVTVSRKRLVELAKSGAPRALFAFDRALKVPHAMIHWREFDNDQARAQARALTFNLIKTKIPIGN